MTEQVNLDLVWAQTGGVTDPGDAKYSTGWVAEIPTYQNFNFVLQNQSANLLALAEKGEFDWDDNISYQPGTKVKGSDGIFYSCVTATVAGNNHNPVNDSTQSYWVTGALFGKLSQDNLDATKGIFIKEVGVGRNPTTWAGNDITIEAENALIALNTTSSNQKNLVLGNVSGSLVVVDVNTDDTPDSRSIALTDPSVYKIYHEGNPPTVDSISGAVPMNPQDGRLYARRNTNWEETTSTTVSTAPPPPITGAGQGWYNLDDGQLYVDVDDGSSSQWVLANPPIIPDTDAEITAVMRFRQVLETDLTIENPYNGLSISPTIADGVTIEVAEDAIYVVL